MAALCERNIDLRITIDTDYLPSAGKDSGDDASPTRIAQPLGHMVVTASREVINQGTGSVIFEARAGDSLRFFVSSGSNNFEQVVLLESIHYAKGDELLEGFTSQTLERTGVVPHSSTYVLPARVVPKQFRFGRCVVAGEGTGIYDLAFVVYGRDEEARPRLIGHYRWAMQLTVTR